MIIIFICNKSYEVCSQIKAISVVITAESIVPQVLKITSR